MTQTIRGKIFSNAARHNLGNHPTHPHHPPIIAYSGFRTVTVSGNTATIVGKDEPDRPTWKLSGEVDGNGVLIDFRPKGGPPNLLGKFDGQVMRTKTALVSCSFERHLCQMSDVHDDACTPNQLKAPTLTQPILQTTVLRAATKGYYVP